jgi:hypothetical protein
VKRKFVLLTVIGALIALAIPTSSMGALYPAGAKFEIAGNSVGPRLETSLGSCLLGKVTGQIPNPPVEGAFSIANPTAGNCTTGVSMTIGGTWKFWENGQTALLIGNGPESIVMRFSSLPGCKLATSGALLYGVWGNGVTTPHLFNSYFAADSVTSLAWANDGGSCALAGTKEAVSFTSSNSSSPYGIPSPSTVTNLTNPNAPIVFGF